MQKQVWYSVICSMVVMLIVGWLMAAAVHGQEAPQGLEQSPIDIRAEDVVVVHDDGLPALHFRYGTRVTLNVVNTGSPDPEATVRANVPAGTGWLRVEGVIYNLLQFHWHTPSEHVIAGAAFPMEMHLVHQAADGALLVVGVFIVEGHRHPELDEIFAHLPAEDDSTMVPRFNLRRLLPKNRESFRYWGSLTTPPFTEGVQWVVLAEPLEMSAQQIQAFEALFPQGNSREVQPLNERIVVTDRDIDNHDEGE
jgi:carbonic anhydrase